MASKNFWFKFVPADWRKDPDLSRCSFAAKGFWIDMICILQETEEPGIFKTNGIPWSDREITAAVGGDVEVGLSCLSELLTKGVCSRSKDGAIFARRIVRDHQKRIKCIEAGKRGGNPALHKAPLTVPLKGIDKGVDKGQDKGASNSNSYSYSSEAYEQLKKPVKKQFGLSREEFLDVQWAEFLRIAQERSVLSGGETDWTWAYSSWRVLDWEQKQKAIEDVRVRPEDSPEMQSLPQNYIKGRKWQRPIVDRKAGNRLEEMWRDA